MHRTIFAAAAGLAIAIAAPVLAQGTQGVVAAQQAGLVGERFDGYLGYVTTPSPALRRQVDFRALNLLEIASLDRRFDAAWQAYRDVNRAFADAAVASAPSVRPS